MERTLVFAGLAALSLLSGLAAFANEGHATPRPLPSAAPPPAAHARG